MKKKKKLKSQETSKQAARQSTATHKKREWKGLEMPECAESLEGGEWSS